MSDFETVDAEIVDINSIAERGEPCEFCGTPVDPASSFCPACGAQRTAVPNSTNRVTTPDASTAPLETLPEGGGEHESPHHLQQRFFECQNCGSRVAMDQDHRSYVCAFCDSAYVVEFSREDTNRRQPDFVIGFEVTPERAHELFRQWISDNSWFRPGDLDQARIDQRLVGVYLPFWSFSALAKSNWNASIGEYWYRTETYRVRNAQGKMETRTRTVRETEWWPLSGKHHRYYTSYLVSGSKSLTQSEAEQIKPYNLPALKRYAPFYLAGWLCEEYTVPHDTAIEIAHDVLTHQEHSNVAAFLPGDTFSNLQVQTSFSYLHSDLCLLPVYVWSYKYRDKLYRFVVNGQTERMAGQKPISKTRVALFVFIILAILALVGIAVYLLGAR